MYKNTGATVIVGEKEDTSYWAINHICGMTSLDFGWPRLVSIETNMHYDGFTTVLYY